MRLSFSERRKSNARSYTKRASEEENKKGKKATHASKGPETDSPAKEGPVDARL